MAVSTKKKKSTSPYASTTPTMIQATTVRQDQDAALRQQYQQEQAARRQSYESSGYKPGQTVQQIQAQASYGQRPAGYNSKYGAQLDSIMQQIQGNPDFKYELNGDNLFNQYKDMYTQLGRQASMDAMGQAAGLTGGYGSSYGQQVGTQAYQQNLLSLYDKGMELRDRAYQQYRDQLGDKYNLFGLYQGRDETDYGRYRDTMADWENDRNFEESMRQFEAQRADQDYQFESSLAQSSSQFDRTSEQEWAALEEKQREADNTLTEEQRQYEKTMALNYVKMMIAAGKTPSNELMVAAGLSKKDAKALLEQPATGGGGGSSGGKTQYYIDDKGFVYTKDAQGNIKYVGHKSTLPDDTPVTPEKGTKGAQAYLKGASDRDRETEEKKRKAMQGG